MPPLTISVIIPAHNAAATIGETLDSVFAQTHAPDEVIVVDDGSADETSAILDGYDHRLRVIRQGQTGRAAACNRGAKEARSRLIAFLDADDVWLPGKLERQLTECADAVLSYTNSTYFGEMVAKEIVKDDLTPQPSGDVLEALLLGNFITGSSVVVRRDVFLECGGFDESYDCVQDWPLWLRICSQHQLGYVAEPLVRYRVHRAATTMKVRRTLPAHLRVLNEAFAPDGPAAHLGHLREQAIAHAYQCVGFYASEAGDGPLTIRCAVASRRKSPMSVSNWKRLVKGGLLLVGCRF